MAPIASAMAKLVRSQHNIRSACRLTICKDKQMREVFTDMHLKLNFVKIIKNICAKIYKHYYGYGNVSAGL